MSPALVARVDRAVYRAALTLCPSGFRDDYVGEMLLDFEATRAEASARGAWSDLWRWRLRLALDLVRTLSVQWARTRLPLIGLASIIVPLAMVAALAKVAARARFGDLSTLDDPELAGILLLAVTSVLLIATTIALTVWAAHPRRVRR